MGAFVDLVEQFFGHADRYFGVFRSAGVTVFFHNRFLVFADYAREYAFIWWHAILIYTQKKHGKGRGMKK